MVVTQILQNYYTPNMVKISFVLVLLTELGINLLVINGNPSKKASSYVKKYHLNLFKNTPNLSVIFQVNMQSTVPTKQKGALNKIELNKL